MIYIDRAVIEINGGCNYSCSMCPQGKPGRSKNFLKVMPLDQFERIVAEVDAKVINLEGSGEATINPKLPEYIKIVKKYGAKCFIFSNGFRMHGDYMKRSVDAGLDYFRFSVIGYDKITYLKRMDSINFSRVVQNIREMKEYTEGSNCQIATYHLMFEESDLERYRDLSENQLGVNTEIWKLHNWAGSYTEANRVGAKKTCGRPFSPDIVIRAGGLNGKSAAVHPCCQVLGRDDEAVLGHLSDQTIEEVWNGKEYEALREAHKTGKYPDFCKECDFLIDDPSVLVYSNYNRSLYHMHGSNFSLEDFRPK